MVFGSDFTSTAWYREPAVGTSVTLTPGLTDSDTSGFPMEEITAMVSGGPRLVENGAICTTLEPGFQEARFTSAVTSRTALGKLVIVSTGSASIQQLRELMLQLGCVEAVNLDGGGSTALAYQGKLIRSPGRELTTTLQIFAH
jgi:exopolysaccharide biosynthesis protein